MLSRNNNKLEQQHLLLGTEHDSSSGNDGEDRELDEALSDCESGISGPNKEEEESSSSEGVADAEKTCHKWEGRSESMREDL